MSRRDTTKHWVVINGEDALWDDARPADEVWTEALDWWEVAA